MVKPLTQLELKCIQANCMHGDWLWKWAETEPAFFRG